MSLERDQELIGEYVEWSARMKAMALDVSPERFVVEKAKQEAFERVEAAIEYLEKLGDDADAGDVYHILTTGGK